MERQKALVELTALSLVMKVRSDTDEERSAWISVREYLEKTILDEIKREHDYHGHKIKLLNATRRSN
jgi:hypothetical protein